MEYIKLPTAKPYGMLFISSISFSVEEVYCELNFKWAAKGVGIGLEFFMLSFSRTHSM